MIEDKKNKLVCVLKSTGRSLVAFSGGVDSTYLLYAAKEVLGKENVLAVIAESPTYPSSEIETAIKLAESLEVECQLIHTEEFSDENFVCNSKERCYYCKKELFAKLKEIGREKGFEQIVDGSNQDDLSDFRPGSRAREEFGVRSPLQEAGLTKEEIRQLSKEAGLPTWDKPSMACLASRIPYGTRIDEGILAMVRGGEEYLKSLGFLQSRVRHHDSIARIEVEPEAIPHLVAGTLKDEILKKFEELGYTYITIDLKGYRTGSMNETDLP